MDKQRLEARRAFNEALRARMRLVSTEHNIPEGDMKWLCRLRHYDLVNFVQKHKLCWTWVLGGDDLQGQPRRGAALSTSGRQRTARWSPRVIGAWPHEAAPIDPEAQPTAVGGTSQKAEAMRAGAVFGPPFLVECHRGL
jgi:hypothetical protein